MPGYRRPDVSIGSYRVWQRNRDVTLQRWKTEFLGTLMEPVFIILALGLALGQFVELDSGEDYVVFLTPGLVALFPMFAAAFECGWGSFVRLEMQGIHRATLATPVSVDDVITGDIFWGATRSVLSAAAILLVAVVLNPWLHMVSSPWAILVVPLSFVPGILFGSISIAFAAFARAMSQFSYFFNFILNPMFWFGGAFFPIEDLPGWAQVVAWFIPLTHVVELYRGFIDGEFAATMLVDVAWLVVASVIFYGVGIASMRRRLID